MSDQSLQQIIEWAGSQAALARMLGVTRSAVNLWRRDGIPAERAIQIEDYSGGKFKATKIMAGQRAA